MLFSSVRIDVDQLLRDREEERGGNPTSSSHPRTPSQEAEPLERPKKKRKPVTHASDGPKTKKAKIVEPFSGIKHTKLTLKLGPRPAAPEPFPCCLCVNMSKDRLLPVHDPPTGRMDFAVDELPGSVNGPKEWMAHEDCANVVPETWVDYLDLGEIGPDGTRTRLKMAFGVDGIVKDRWNLVRVVFCFLFLY